MTVERKGPAVGHILVLVGSNQVLPIWEWKLPSRDIGASESADSTTRPFFSKRYIYGVYASRTGDGCGFQGESQEAQQARNALAAFLEQILINESEIELFVEYFDATTPGLEPSSYDCIGPSDIRTWRSNFRPGEFLVVTKDV
jgi:hypothetical protein